MFQSFMTRHWFEPDAVAIWSDANTVQGWLDVEAALAQAQGELGVIPVEVVPAIVAACRADRLDFQRLSTDIAHAQHPFVPVLKQVERLPATSIGARRPRTYSIPQLPCRCVAHTG